MKHAIGDPMKSIPDAVADARRAWLDGLQRSQKPAQSDFERSAVWRSTLIAAVIVIGVNLFSPAPTPIAVQPASHHTTV
jgi:hypothetical protein